MPLIPAIMSACYLLIPLMPLQLFFDSLILLCSINKYICKPLIGFEIGFVWNTLLKNRNWLYSSTLFVKK